jgi:hypothetical protein
LIKMNKEQIFAAWSPNTSLWSVWVKPVLFAHLDIIAAAPELPGPSQNINWCPPKENKVVVVADLPGAEGVFLGVSLAERGYCPVPLYNAIPLPGGGFVLDPFTSRSVAAVNILPVISALRQGAEQLVNLKIASDASPVFLLDANRHGDGRVMLPDEFDNRSVCFTTDFPSANFLVAHGFQRALLVQNHRQEPQPDLAHVLRRWQEGGIILERVRTDLPAVPERFEVARPSRFGAMWQRALMALGLRRASGGGFGAWIPDSSAGG